MRNREKLFQQYIDGELSPEEEKHALHEIAEDEDLRSMLRFEQKLNDILSPTFFQSGPNLVPEGFSERVMEEVYNTEAPKSMGFIDRLQAWYHGLWIPKEIQWRPVYAFVVVALLLFSFGYPLYMVQNMNEENSMVASDGAGLYDSVQQVSSENDEVMLRFFYIDEEASSVSVAGDFNDWKPVEMSPRKVNGKQVWTANVSVKRGEHNYMFVKDGEKWVTDPLATVHRDDGFGNKNAVIYL